MLWPTNISIQTAGILNHPARSSASHLLSLPAAKECYEKTIRRIILPVDKTAAISTSPVTASRLLLASEAAPQPKCQKCQRHGIRWTGLFASYVPAINDIVFCKALNLMSAVLFRISRLSLRSAKDAIPPSSSGPDTSHAIDSDPMSKSLPSTFVFMSMRPKTISSE